MGSRATLMGQVFAQPGTNRQIPLCPNPSSVHNGLAGEGAATRLPRRTGRRRSAFTGDGPPAASFFIFSYLFFLLSLLRFRQSSERERGRGNDRGGGAPGLPPTVFPRHTRSRSGRRFFPLYFCFLLSFLFFLSSYLLYSFLLYSFLLLSYLILSSLLFSSLRHNVT